MNNIIKKISGYFFANLIAKIISFSVFIYASKVLTPEIYGFFGLMNSGISMVSIIVTAGLPSLIFTHYVNMSKSKKVILLNQINNLYIRNIILFTIVFSLFFFINKYIHIINIKIPFIILIISFFIVICNYINHMTINLLRVENKINLLSLLLVTTSLLMAISTLILLYLKYYKIVLFVALLIPGIVYSIFYYNNYVKNKIIIRSKNYNYLLYISIPITASSLIAIAIIFTDKIFLALYLSLEDVGIYEIAYKFGMMYDIFIVQVFNTIYVTFILKNLKKNYQKYFNINFLIVYINILIVPILIYLLPIDLFDYLKNLIGVNFYKSIEYIKYIIIYFVLFHSFSMISIFFLYLKKTNMILFGSIIMFLVNIIGNYILIPNYGILGSVYSSYLSVLSVIIIITIYLIIQKKEVYNG